MMPRLLLPLAVLAFASTAVAQTAAPPAGAPPTAPSSMSPQGQRPAAPPVNLQVLPKDMTRQQVVEIMRHWEGDLGVECEYCHAKNPQTGRNDFASDANPKKDIARLMLRMTENVNHEYVAKVTPPTEAKVTCGTCHRGMAKPAVFTPPPHEHHPGGPAAPAGATPPQPPPGPPAS